MRFSANRALIEYKKPCRGALGALFSRAFALLIIAVLLCAHAGTAFAEETAGALSSEYAASEEAAGDVPSVEADQQAEEEPSSEFALAGAGSGRDVTVHFGTDEDQEFRIHVNPANGTASSGAEAEPVPGGQSGTGDVSEEETEAETESESAEQTEYVYEDENVKVVATLQYAWAVPDGAVLRVTQITPDSADYNYSAYMDALNENSPDAVTEYSEQNTLLYDIGFYVPKLDENGQVIDGAEVEYEPEEGSVDVSVEFKKSQLTEEIGISNSEEISITHLPLKEEFRKDPESTSDGKNITASDIQPEAVDVQTDSVVLRQDDADEVAFRTDSFSTYAFSNGTITAIQTVEDFDLASYLGAGYHYGVIANVYEHEGDTETNVMVGKYSSTASEVGASSNYSNAGGNCYIGEIGSIPSDGIRFYQPPAYVFLGPEATKQYHSGELTFDTAHLGEAVIVENSSIQVSSVLQSIGTKFAQLSGLGGAFHGGTIDLRNQPAGTYIVQYDGAELNESTLNVWTNPELEQRLIINCTQTHLTIRRYNLNGHQSTNYTGTSDPANDLMTTAVVFHMVNGGSVDMFEGMGVIINPYGSVDTKTEGHNGGILVANYTTGGVEWHFHDHELDSPDRRDLKAIKNIDGVGANVSGFKFVLSEKRGTEWVDIQEKTNNGPEIAFDHIVYNSENCTNDVTEFVYRIKELDDQSGLDNQEAKYETDASVYYAKVVVTASSEGERSVYTAANPVYFSDEGCTVRLEGMLPVFENHSRTIDLKIRKVWKAKDGSLITGGYPQDEISFTLYRAVRTDGVFTTPPTEGGTAIYTYTLGKDGVDLTTTTDDWAITIPNLPMKTTQNGVTQYYAYYVKENPEVQGYEVSYANYCLSTHEITITNTEEDTTAITVEKKWFRGDSETTGPAVPVIFDLYRVKSTTPPGSGSSAGASARAAGSTAADVITDYTVNVKWGYYNADQTDGSYPVHEGDRIHITATSCSAATFNVSADWPYQKLNQSVTGKVTHSETKTFVVDQYYSYTKNIVTTELDYVVPAVEAEYDSNHSVQALNGFTLSFYFGNNPDNDIETSYAVTHIPAGSVSRTMNAAPAPVWITHEQACAQGGTNEWEEESHEGEEETHERVKVIHRYTLSAEEGWTWTSGPLPASETDSSGQTVYYTYYVREQSGSAYDLSETTYGNNEGIQSGTITIRNKLPDVTYTYTNVSVTKQWLGDHNRDISREKSEPITFVLIRNRLQGGEEVTDDSSYAGGSLKNVEGVTLLANGHYQITPQPDGTDENGNTIYRWPTAEILSLPYQVVNDEGTVLCEYRYYVDEPERGGHVDAVYRVGEGSAVGYCGLANGSTVTIINREMEQYYLPATGGEGTRRLILMGILLIALAGAGLLMVRQKSRCSKETLI